MDAASSNVNDVKLATMYSSARKLNDLCARLQGAQSLLPTESELAAAAASELSTETATATETAMDASLFRLLLGLLDVARSKASASIRAVEEALVHLDAVLLAHTDAASPADIDVDFDVDSLFLEQSRTAQVLESLCAYTKGWTSIPSTVLCLQAEITAVLESAPTSREPWSAELACASWHPLFRSLVFEPRPLMLALFRAVATNSFAVLHFVVEHELVEHLNHFDHIVYGETLLMKACRSHNAAMVRVLLALPAHLLNVNEVCSNLMRTAFMISMYRHQHEAVSAAVLEIAEAFLALPAGRLDLCAVDMFGMSALNIACSQGHTEIARRILWTCRSRSFCTRSQAQAQAQAPAKAVDIFSMLNTCDREGNTPLMNACSGQHVEIVKLLLAEPAVRLHHRNRAQYSAFTLAILRENAIIASLLEDAVVRRRETEEALK